MFLFERKRLGEESVTDLGFRLIWFDFSDYLFKLLLIGDSSVGKSCLLLRFAVGLSSLHRISPSLSLSLISSLPFLAGWLLCGQLHKYHWSWFRNHHFSSFLLWLFLFLFLFMSRHFFSSLSRKSEPSTYKEKPSSSRLWVFFSYTLFLGFLTIYYLYWLSCVAPTLMLQFCPNFCIRLLPNVGYWESAHSTISHIFPSYLHRST